MRATLALALLLALEPAGLLRGADTIGIPRLTFTKEFPRSNPDYYRIELGEDGQARYFTAPPSTSSEDTGTINFRVSPRLARQAFELAARLNYFRGAALETRKKVASMGKKTVVYESGAERSQAVFNYSENSDAMALVELFEKISNTQQHLLALDRLTRFDKLGLMKQLLSLESALDKRDLAEPALLVPALEEISRNNTYLHIAQQRARIILAKIYDQK